MRLDGWDLWAQGFMPAHKLLNCCYTRVGHKLGRQRPGTVSWVLRAWLGAHHLISPAWVIKLGVRHPRMSERKKGRQRSGTVSWVLRDESSAPSPLNRVLKMRLRHPIITWLKVSTSISSTGRNIDFNSYFLDMGGISISSSISWTRTWGEYRFQSVIAGQGRNNGFDRYFHERGGIRCAILMSREYWCRASILMLSFNPLTATLFESHELCSKPTDCSRPPLIAKWYLGGPLTNSFVPK